jgi:hypothetical protein
MCAAIGRFAGFLLRDWRERRRKKEDGRTKTRSAFELSFGTSKFILNIIYHSRVISI